MLAQLKWIFTLSLFAVVAAVSVSGSARADDSSKKNKFYLAGPSDESVVMKYYINKKVAAGTEITASSDEVTVNVSDIKKDKPESSVQLIFKVSLKEGEKYRLEFTASAEKDARLDILYVLHKKPFTAYSKGSVSVKKGVHQYTSIIAPASADGNYPSNSSLRLFVGGFKSSKLTLSDVKLVLLK